MPESVSLYLVGVWITAGLAAGLGWHTAAVIVAKLSR